ncbi:hypothetical protein L861_16830 [Litchfieldella anticariensis FP35 = DSM 16096]|uniref:Uncharacterized protein n=1 Tax=Litchfieldella anticariensis (strain DSM 16096 / CECT 5854 / CIP 108499 / LMG 22089 / FP35) TaxID=1121939 RepID=S2LA02_LITA3|nr:hypothetical protein [Halomonas anticariensis]EPC01536.1 hypothetical protein L861_16830 [Halomonas anticariensis FP35 = DSM 16096]
MTLRDQWLEEIAGSPFDEPLQVASEERRYSVSGSVYARIPHSLETLTQELRSASAWCDIMFLHLNVEACLHDERKDSDVSGLQIHVGRQDYQPLSEAERLDLNLRVVSMYDQYLAIVVEGDEGPYSTRAFRLQLQAMPYSEHESLVHLRYSLVFGWPARVAMSAYFAFGGRDRVGFTIEGYGADGEPRYVGGTRGMIERNVMRFYLALAVHLDTRAVPEAERLDERLRRWFAATERYPRQLHELDEQRYLEQKRREYERQEALRNE